MRIPVPNLNQTQPIHLECLGGKGPVPWRRLERASTHDYVQLSRLPSGVHRLTDPNTWTRAEIEAWYRHILNGQLGQLPQEWVFQFCRVDRNDGTECARYVELCRTRPPIATLTWGPDEKLYALHLSQQGCSADPQREWGGLPLARTEHVYIPLDEELVDVFSGMSTADVPLDQLCHLVRAGEHLGPVHVCLRHLS